MGTRGLTRVKINGMNRIAQYGQWDHYPEGVGLDVLRFTHKMLNEGRLEEFEEKVKATRFQTPEKIEAVLDACRNTVDAAPAWLHRNTGPEILDLVLNEGQIELEDNSDFAEDEVSCEGVAEIDLSRHLYSFFYNRGKCLIPFDSFLKFPLEEIEKSFLDNFGY